MRNMSKDRDFDIWQSTSEYMHNYAACHKNGSLLRLDRGNKKGDTKKESYL